MLQIAGIHYNYVKKEWQEVSADEATINLYRQILVGDRSDNVPGLPKVGEVTAEKIIYNATSASVDALSFYREICEERLPDVDYAVYFAEQEALIRMITNVDMYKLFTTRIAANTEGFEAQDGEDIRETRNVKL